MVSGSRLLVHPSSSVKTDLVCVICHSVIVGLVTDSDVSVRFFVTLRFLQVGMVNSTVHNCEVANSERIMGFYVGRFTTRLASVAV